jgi:hypothetical protein
MTAPDVIVAWLQNDYGKLGRPAEAMAHAMAEEGLARRVAYIEPFHEDPAPPTVDRSTIRGVDVWTGRGTPPVGRHELAEAVLANSGLEDPILLNCGMIESNWWFQYEFAPFVSTSVLVLHDNISIWEGLADKAPRLRAIRRLLVGSSDAVCGLSQGSIDDLPGATYVGHGTDDVWGRPGVDDTPEPADLAAIPHPRAVYVGALMMRFDIEATRALARSGVHVVVIGFEPTPAVQELFDTEPDVHFLGQRQVEDTPGYLLHGDVGVIPHTDEPFTRTMEPHKAYNYAAAGLRTVTIRTHTAPALGPVVETTESVEDFVAAVHRAIERGRLPADEVARVRAISWGSVAARILDVAQRVRRA